MQFQLIIIWIPELIPRDAANILVFNQDIGRPSVRPSHTWTQRCTSCFNVSYLRNAVGAPLIESCFVKSVQSVGNPRFFLFFWSVQFLLTFCLSHPSFNLSRSSHTFYSKLQFLNLRFIFTVLCLTLRLLMSYIYIYIYIYIWSAYS